MLSMQGVVVCLSILVMSSTHGSVFDPDQVSGLEEFVKTLMDCKNIPGLTLAVVRGNETLTKGFGVVNMTSGQNVTSSTLFGIGSVTKAFTATILAMLLSESENYTWDTPLVSILGDDFRLGDAYVTQQVTLKDLLTHRTGMAVQNLPLFAAFLENVTRAEYAKRLRYFPMSGRFRDKMVYNNWMYTLAGYVAEVLGKASWEDLVLKRIFQPLGMSDSRIIGKTINLNADNFALPYVRVREDIVASDPSIYGMSPQEPAGAIASSADDMAKWLKLHLQKGQLKEGQLLDYNILQNTYASYVTLPPGVDGREIIKKPTFPVTWISVGYGYGWFISEYQGYKVIWHSGGHFAYTTFLAFILDLDLAVFISVNGPGDIGRTNSQILLYIIDLVLGEEPPWQNVTNACKFPQPWVNSTSQPRPPLNHTIPGGFGELEIFVGKYGNRIFGDVEVVRNGTDGLWASYNRLFGKLHRTAVDHVLLMEMMGGFHFLSAKVNATYYVNLTFVEPAQDRKYQEILMSASDMGESYVLNFKREVRFSDPLPKDTSGKDKMSASVLTTLLICLSFPYTAVDQLFSGIIQFCLFLTGLSFKHYYYSVKL